MPSLGPQDLRRLALPAQVGMEMVAPIVLGLVIDYQFGWLPWCTVVGAVLGFVAGVGHLILIATRMNDPPGAEPPGRDEP
jgi:F0F1-type ATP synthase assembly protein I